MPIKNIQIGQTGLVGVEPKFDYILTDDTVAEVLTAGYLNHSVDAGYSFSQGDIVPVITQSSPSARKRSGMYQVDHNGNNWSLIPLESSPLLAMAQYTTVGGAASEAISIPGILASDLADIQMVNDGANNVTALQAACTANTLTVTFSGNPGGDAVINYWIYRT